ncbi:hypothetical protein [Aurantiacibacter suaedae]|nr:hypothetical protein [Aurantiacibacter suaedae]
MHITNTRAAQWSRLDFLSADLSQAVIPFTRSAKLTTRDLRRLVAEMID